MEDLPQEERKAMEDPLTIILNSLRNVMYKRNLVSSTHLELDLAAKCRGDYCALVDFFEQREVIPHVGDLNWMLESVGGEKWIQQWVPQVFGELNAGRINVSWILDQARTAYYKQNKLPN